MLDLSFRFTEPFSQVINIGQQLQTKQNNTEQMQGVIDTTPYSNVAFSS